MDIQLTQRQKTILAIAFLVLTAVGFAAWQFYVPEQMAWSERAAEVAAKQEQLKKLREEFHNDDPGKELEQLDTEIVKWRLAYNTRKGQFGSKVEPLTQDFKGFEWLKRYEDVQKKLLEQAYSRGLSIPETLGFTDAVPATEQAELLNLQLHNMESIVKTIFASEGITSVTALGPMPETASGHPKVKILPYNIEMKAKIDGVRNFLNNIAKSADFFSVSSLKITQSEGDEVTIGLTLTTVLVQD